MEAKSTKSNPLKDLWNEDSSNSFADWVLKVNDAYYETGLSLGTASRLAGARPAELLAVLRLASLDENSLALIETAKPPKTTWLSLSKASPEIIDECLKIVAAKPKSKSAVGLVGQYVRSKSNDSGYERVAAIKGSTLVHFAKKSKEYASLQEKQWKALLSMGKTKSSGKVLSTAQRKYVTDLLTILIKDNVISENSLDGDQELCNEVLFHFRGEDLSD